MKKVTLLLTTILIVTAAFGQKALRTTAFNNLRKGELDKALQNIEPTISDASTMNDPKTWFYRGNIYLQIQMSENSDYKALDNNALLKAYDSYQKVLELDAKKEYYTETFQNLFIISEQFYNEGVKNFTLDPPNYAMAFKAFETSVMVNESFGSIDTLAMFNAALSAENARDFSNAKLYYTKVKDMGYPQPLLYNSLATIHIEEGDTTSAIAILSEGRKKYPDNFNLLIAETNIYLSSKQNDKAMANLVEAVKTDPMNPTIHYAVGVNYALMGDVAEAEKAYLKAVEINPDYFEANYNLGALYVNEAALSIEEANKLPLSAVQEYDALKVKADDILRKSIPFLEKASALDTTDRSTLLSLKEIYTRLQMYDKMKEINDKISELE
ncbi:MAG: tetratricopeptide repeat protein [Lentimicrobium sp.]|nr:tetratricopeptide repeat protein [Lentimicrobium sp.]